MNFKKLFIFCFLFLISGNAFPQGKAFVPLNNHESKTISGVDDLGNVKLIRVDSTGNLTATLIPPILSPTNGVVDIPNAGPTDRIQLPSLIATSCTIQAAFSNLGRVYVGGPTVTNASGINEGLHLIPSATISNVSVSNLNEIYISTDNAGDDIKYLCN